MVKKSPSSAHTPGPWDVQKAWRDRTEPSNHWVYADGLFIAEVDGERPEALANARLIAAAPELLAACKTALEDARRAITGEWDIGSTDCPADGFRCQAEYLEQVIAAAEGRKPRRLCEDLRRAAA